jgi:ABC-type sugar transport system substrate-binding protein
LVRSQYPDRIRQQDQAGEEAKQPKTCGLKFHSKIVLLFHTKHLRGSAMKKIARLVGVLLILALVLPSTIRTVRAADTKKICFAFQDVGTEFWVASFQAIKEALKKEGFEVTELNAGHDANRQLEQIKDCIAQKVDGIILIAQDGESGSTIVSTAQEADIPIATFNRPPADMTKGIVVVADNQLVARQAVEFMAQKALGRFEVTGKKSTPVILVGDLADPNAVKRRAGFMDVINKYPNLFNKPIEIATGWDAQKALAGLEAAVTANPDVDFIFTSSDFLFPTIRGVLDSHKMWIPTGQKGHVILGGLDGDATACKLIKDGYVDATGVQDLYTEAKMTVDGLLGAIKDSKPQTNVVLQDPGFALNAGNIDFREKDMWGCVLLAAGFLDKK